MSDADPPAATVDDWTRVDAGTFHAFHQAWVTYISEGLNDGGLPPGYYAHQERRFGSVTAAAGEGDLLALEMPPGEAWEPGNGGGSVLLEAAPKAAVETDLSDLTEEAYYADRANRLTLKREIDHRVVALIEICSPGNKDRRESVDRFTRKVVDAMEDGIHFVLIDLLPPGPFDPAGMHGAVLGRLRVSYAAPEARPLCCAGYRAGVDWRAFAEPLAVGDPLPTVPLFLTPRHHVPLDLAPSYPRARRNVGAYWEQVVRGEREGKGRAVGEKSSERRGVSPPVRSSDKSSLSAGK